MAEDKDRHLDNHRHGRLSKSSVIRCLLAFACSHVAAPYAAARVTIQCLLTDTIHLAFALFAGIVIIVGAVLAYRQLVDQPLRRKGLFGLTGIVLWIVMAFVQLAIVADSAVPMVVLGCLWAAGTVWVAWSVWAFSFFRAGGVAVGSGIVGLGVVLLWSLIDVTGLTGDAEVEFAWRRNRESLTESPATVSGTVSTIGSVAWPGYLGSNRDGQISNFDVNDDWASHPPRELWRMSCGHGWSSFAATETTLFGQEQLNGTDCVTARDLNTGDVIWTASENRPGFKSGMGGHGPRATPTLHVNTDGDTTNVVLFSIGPTGLLSCLDANDGRGIWQTDVTDLFPGDNLSHGVCGSPLVVDDMVVVCPPAPQGPCLAAFDMADGKLVWQCKSDWRASYASPCLLTICDHPQIVLHAGPGALAVDPADGRVLWRFAWTNEWDNNATQPQQLSEHPNDLLLATGYRGGAVRLAFSLDGEGHVQPQEIWKTSSTMRTKFCNFAQFGNVVVGLDNGILCGVDAETGRRLWKNGRYGHGQILKVGEHLMVMEERGRLNLLKPDAEGHHPLGNVAALDRKTWNHPVLVDDFLILRNDQEIVCLQLSPSDSDASTTAPHQ
jgi:outer membrane protein assembly factor BamB